MNIFLIFFFGEGVGRGVSGSFCYEKFFYKKTCTKNFPCGLLISCSKLLFNEERNDVNPDTVNNGKSLTHSCKIK